MNFSEYTDIGKALLLMGMGISFVFIVQVVFYIIIKLYPKGKTE